MFNNHNHSEFSNAQLGFADSTNKLTKLIQTAYDIGLDGIALTDHEGIQGHIKAWKYYQSMDKDRDFKLALGNEIYLMTEQQYLENQNPKGQYTPYYHFILTALDTTGHRQIRELSNRAWQRATAIKGFMRKPTYYVDIEEIIGVNKGHVIGSTACLGSLLDKLILNYKLNNDQSCKQEIHKFIQWGLQTFGKGNFYLEIQPCNEDNIEQRTVNTMMWTLSQAYDIPIIPTTDSHYLIKEHSFIHKTLLQSKDGDREVDAFYATTYLMSDKELREYLRLDFTDEQIDIMFNYSMSIHNRVQDYELKHAPVIPEIPDEYIPDFQIQHIFKEWYDKYPYFKYYATEAIYIHDRYFFYRIEQGLQNKIVDKGLDIKTYIQRCDTEFKELKDLSESFHSSMASYYSTFKNIIDIIWDSDSLSMPARGSVAAYLISYLLDITQIDPVPLGDYMPYWRHLSKERGDSIPDIDNDSQASKREVILENIKKYFGYDKVLSVSTYNTLTAKTAIERSVKGLHLNDDLAGYLKSLVPVERGNIWSINDCLYGDGDTRKPIKLFIEEVEQYEHLKECLIELEGLVVNRGIHASGVIITNDPYVNYISAMRSPKGVICTSYDLHDCEYCGVVKVDLLTVQAADKIRATLDLLIKYGEIEWQGNIKKTYWKYIHPDVLEYNDSKMWEIIKKIYSVFQFDTAISVQALNRTEPHSVMDLSAANSLLRLQTSGNEQPLDTYVRYKNDINEWRNDCVAYGLTEEEMEVLKEYLSDSYMLADSQEKVMRLSMDKRVANFGLTEANLLRKGIAKKDATAREKSRKQFYEKGLEQGTRQEFLDYIWNDVFSKSFGYSFSQIHSYSYSIIALQEINLNYFYPPVYWNCACLTVESNSFDNEDSSTKKNTDYGKMTTAIYKMKSYGIDIQPPSINRSDISFTPLVKENQILFGLGGIAGINHDIAQEVIDNRPYESFDDFYNKFNTENKTLVTHSKIINLIKTPMVWLCSGQSNMNWSAANGIVDMKQELTGKLNPQIRLFTVTKNSSPYPAEDCVGRWEVCDAESALYFSAVGYFFGKRLAGELRQPVGLVNSSWGGTPVEVWTPASVMKKNPQMVAAWKKHSKYGRGWDIGSLYNAMIVPLLRTTFAGAIWYQGESNKENAALYGEEFRMMIESWRKAFRQSLPFYFVQIAPHARTEGGITGALVREQQARVAATVPETGMVVIPDLVDDVTNIHPAYKKGVGDRLAGWALGEVYGKKDHKYRHAIFRSAEFKRNQVIVSFDHAEGGLVCPEGSIVGLEVCDASMRFVPAQGMIDERTGSLVVWSKGVSRPVAVRYCFSDGAIGNLFDAAGLPVAPFRSDVDNAAAPARLPDDAVSRMEVTARGDGFEVRSFAEGTKPFLNRVYPLTMVPARFAGFEMLVHNAGPNLELPCTVTASAAGRIYLIARRNSMTAADLRGWKRERNSEVRYSTHDKNKPGILDIYYKEVKAGEKVELPTTKDFAGITLLAAKIGYTNPNPKAEAAKTASAPVSRMLVTARGEGYEVRSFGVGAKPFLNRVYPLSVVPERFVGFKMLAHEAGQKLGLRCTVTAGSDGRVYLVARRNKYTAADLKGWTREPDSEVRYTTHDKSKPGILDIYYKEVKSGDRVALPVTDDFAGMTLIANEIEYEK